MEISIGSSSSSYSSSSSNTSKCSDDGRRTRHCRRRVSPPAHENDDGGAPRRWVETGDTIRKWKDQIEPGEKRSSFAGDPTHAGADEGIATKEVTLENAQPLNMLDEKEVSQQSSVQSSSRPRVSERNVCANASHNFVSSMNSPSSIPRSEVLLPPSHEATPALDAPHAAPHQQRAPEWEATGGSLSRNGSRERAAPHESAKLTSSTFVRTVSPSPIHSAAAVSPPVAGPWTSESSENIRLAREIGTTPATRGDVPLKLTPHSLPPEDVETQTPSTVSSQGGVFVLPRDSSSQQAKGATTTGDRRDYPVPPPLTSLRPIFAVPSSLLPASSGMSPTAGLQLPPSRSAESMSSRGSPLTSSQVESFIGASDTSAARFSRSRDRDEGQSCECRLSSLPQLYMNTHWEDEDDGASASSRYVDACSARPPSQAPAPQSSSLFFAPAIQPQQWSSKSSHGSDDDGNATAQLASALPAPTLSTTSPLAASSVSQRRSVSLHEFAAKASVSSPLFTQEMTQGRGTDDDEAQEEVDAIAEGQDRHTLSPAAPGAVSMRSTDRRIRESEMRTVEERPGMSDDASPPPLPPAPWRTRVTPASVEFSQRRSSSSLVDSVPQRPLGDGRPSLQNEQLSDPREPTAASGSLQRVVTTSLQHSYEAFQHSTAPDVSTTNASSSPYEERCEPMSTPQEKESGSQHARDLLKKMWSTHPAPLSTSAPAKALLPTTHNPTVLPHHPNNGFDKAVGGICETDFSATELITSGLHEGGVKSVRWVPNSNNEVDFNGASLTPSSVQPHIDSEASPVSYRHKADSVATTGSIPPQVNGKSTSSPVAIPLIAHPFSSAKHTPVAAAVFSEVDKRGLATSTAEPAASLQSMRQIGNASSSSEAAASWPRLRFRLTSITSQCEDSKAGQRERTPIRGGNPGADPSEWCAMSQLSCLGKAVDEGFPCTVQNEGAVVFFSSSPQENELQPLGVRHDVHSPYPPNTATTRNVYGGGGSLPYTMRDRRHARRNLEVALAPRATRLITWEKGDDGECEQCAGVPPTCSWRPEPAREGEWRRTVSINGESTEVAHSWASQPSVAQQDAPPLEHRHTTARPRPSLATCELERPPSSASRPSNADVFSLEAVSLQPPTPMSRIGSAGSTGMAASSTFQHMKPGYLALYSPRVLAARVLEAREVVFGMPNEAVRLEASELSVGTETMGPDRRGDATPAVGSAVTANVGLRPILPLVSPTIPSHLHIDFTSSGSGTVKTERTAGAAASAEPWSLYIGSGGSTFTEELQPDNSGIPPRDDLDSPHHNRRPLRVARRIPFGSPGSTVADELDGVSSAVVASASSYARGVPQTFSDIALLSSRSPDTSPNKRRSRTRGYSSGEKQHGAFVQSPSTERNLCVSSEASTSISPIVFPYPASRVSAASVIHTQPLGGSHRSALVGASFSSAPSEKRIDARAGQSARYPADADGEGNTDLWVQRRLIQEEVFRRRHITMQEDHRFSIEVTELNYQRAVEYLRLTSAEAVRWRTTPPMTVDLTPIGHADASHVGLRQVLQEQAVIAESLKALTEEVKSITS